jgi:hypothetical protein
VPIAGELTQRAKRLVEEDVAVWHRLSLPEAWLQKATHGRGEQRHEWKGA